MVQTYDDAPSKLVTLDMMAEKALFLLRDLFILPHLSNHSYQGVCDKKIIDGHVTVKRPPRVKVNKGQAITDDDIANRTDDTVEICVKQHHFAMQTVDLDRSLNIVDFGDRYLEIGCADLADEYDKAGFDELAAGCFHMSGTPGTAIGTDSFHKASTDADMLGISTGSQRIAILDPHDAVAIRSDVKDDSVRRMGGSAIQHSYEGRIAGSRLYTSAHIKPLTIPSQSGHIPVLHASSAVRGPILRIDGLAANKKWLNKGNLISIADCNQIQHRGSRAKTDCKATFTVTEDVTADTDGEAMISIYPYINDGESTITARDGSTPIRPKSPQTVDAVPAAGAAITVVGGSSNGEKSYRQGMLYDKRAMEYLMVPPSDRKPTPCYAQKTIEEMGLSISVLAHTIWETRQEWLQFDTQFGVKNIYPELGIRLISAEC